uniref:Uncharacterized protein LOC111135842 isoform X1 n=1 Tax=Crassostrea virginica TaxID=6565 RepID=A0A8B8EPU4_CRAVI|nr:uncharacterized protein LOC111135842 isoform X1 [Crassostrea virginica]
MRANMDQHDLCRQPSAVPFLVQWTPRTALFLLFMCDNLSAFPTRTLVLSDGSAEIPIHPRQSEKQDPPVEVTLERDLFLPESTHTNFAMAFPEIIKTHPTSIKKRSAPDKQACQFLDQISDASQKGAPILSLGILPSVILIIQSYPTSTPLKYLCADEGQSFDFANFSSAERNCSLQNITSAYEDSLLDMEISDPIWIKYEALDQSEVLWMELDLDKRSCQREKSQPKVFDSDVDLQKTLRMVRYENFSVQIQSCCDKRSPDVTTPTGKHRRTPDLTTSLPPAYQLNQTNFIVYKLIFSSIIIIIHLHVYLNIIYLYNCIYTCLFNYCNTYCKIY